MTSAGARSARAPATTGAARSPAPGRGRAVAWCCWLAVAAAVIWNLVSLRALTLPVTYLNDATMHEQMVRFATARLRAGHSPLTSWFPFLGEGSPQFLHYQSLPAILAGAAGLLTGPDAAFRWSLYLLLSSWPVSVYLAARTFARGTAGAGRPAAAAAALMAPFLMSVPGVGYEQQAYTWNGFGVWTQLWAMWTLPLAWAWSWRAIRDGRGYFPAVALTALTAALHFETGYLALAMPLIWPFLAGRPLLARLRRAAIVLGGSLLASAWVIVPLLSQRSWASVNEALQGTGLVNGYGARQVMDWLCTGQVLDAGRLPVITVLAAAGLAVAWLAWSSESDARALLAALAVCLLLAFGRTTFGSLVDVIPGSADLFFRRFMMGVQLAALLLAGRGAAWLAGRAVRLLRSWFSSRNPARGPVPAWWSGALLALAGIIAAAVLAPAWLQLSAFDRADGAGITAQRRADAAQGAEVSRLASVIRRDGGGRVYAGMPTNWGAGFTVGQVPVFKYLESRDVDVAGYTLRTASLMTGPENNFDESVPSDYRLFGIRYLLLPAGQRPPVSARRTMVAGSYALWTVTGGGYVQAGQVTGTLTADRADLGARSVPLLESGRAADGAYLGVRYGSGSGAPASGSGVSASGSGSGVSASGGVPPLVTAGPGRAPAGTVTSSRVRLADGEASATARMDRPGVVVLSASYDPGWTATVNGRAVPVRMVAPALVAVDVPAGTDRVTFRFRGYGGYPGLFALAALALAAVAAGPRAGSRAGRWLRRRRSRSAGPPVPPGP